MFWDANIPGKISKVIIILKVGRVGLCNVYPAILLKI